MWNIDVDLLYWQAQENGLAYVSEERSVINPSFDWNPGCRIGVGYKFPQEWRVDFIFTHFDTHAWGSIEGRLTPLWANPFFFEEDSFVSQATLRWRLHYGQFDLSVGKEITPTEYWTVTPYLGVRVSCIRQKNRLHYYDGTLFPDGDDLITSKNKFLGTGIMTGANLSWKLGKGWSLYSGSTLSILYGEFYVHQGEYADVGVEKRLGFHNTFFASSPVFDLKLGFLWSKKWWEIHLGWEEHFFFSQNQWTRFLGKIQGHYVSNLGDLSLSGAVLGCLFSF